MMKSCRKLRTNGIDISANCRPTAAAWPDEFPPKGTRKDR